MMGYGNCVSFEPVSADIPAPEGPDYESVLSIGVCQRFDPSDEYE